MTIRTADIRVIHFSKVNPAAYNPRKQLKPGDPEWESIARSMAEFGNVGTLVWNERTGNLVGGHQRLAILLHHGATEAPFSVVDLDDAKERALNIALNKISGEWDNAKLAEVLQGLMQGGTDIALTGFDVPDAKSIIGALLGFGPAGQTDPNAIPEPPKVPVTRPGDLIILGDHRLLCGDSTNAADVQRLMDGQRANLFATDPPYLVDYDGTNHPTGKARRKGLAKQDKVDPNKDWSGTYGVTWDDADANSELYDKFVGVAVTHAIAPNAAWYCWHASRRQVMLEAAWVKHGAFVHQQIIWVKTRGVLTRSWYSWRHEPCLMGWIQGNKPTREQPDVLSSVWECETIPNGPERPDHPTPKPVRLFEIPIEQHTRPGDVCFEPFAGSGTQIIAAQRLGRRCFAMERSEVYCDVIVERWEKFTGLKATRTPATNEKAPAMAEAGSAA